MKPRPYIVIDACVAGAWAFAETYTKQAVDILDAIERYHVYPLVPDRFHIEVLRICQKKTGANNALSVSYADALQRFQAIIGLPILSIPSETLYVQAWHLAQATQLTVHDALYLALAIEWNAELWTLDNGLASVPPSIYAHVYDLRTTMFPY